MYELDALLTQAAADVAAGRLDQALVAYQRALALAPANAHLHHNVGVLHAQRGDLTGAERHLAEADRLQPESSVSPLALGHVYFREGRVADAAQAFERAMLRAPDSLEAACNLGITLQALGESARALPILSRVRAHFPFVEVIFRAHFEALQSLGKSAEADQAFLEYGAGATPSAWLASAGLRWARTGRHAECEATYLPMVVNWRYEPPDLPWLAAIMGSIQYFDVSRQDMRSLYRSYDSLMQSSAGSATATPPRSARPAGRVRVGYVSSDFRRHVMGDLMLEVIKRHDRTRFEVFAYSTLPEAGEDARTARFRNCCDAFVVVAALDDAAAAARIAEDGLDLLVDLTGHTPQARPGMLLRKPAPVIVAHLGDHGTIGLRQVDFKLTDAFADLPDAAEYQIERPLAMRGCVMPFRRVPPAPPDPASRERLGIAADAVVLGAFAAVRKLSPRCLGLWRRILSAVPGAHLAISPFTNIERIRCLARLTAAGIPAERIVVIQPSADDAVNRARYRDVDVLLDTLPYTGGDSTVAALDMGVPVVTLAGERHAERMGLSVLSHLGVTDTVASSDDEYVAIACRLATDASARSALSARILERMTASGVADLTQYTRNLEEAFVRALASIRDDPDGRAGRPRDS